MNDQTQYLILPDIDNIILSVVDHSSMMMISSVNKYYNTKLQSYRKYFLSCLIISRNWTGGRPVIDFDFGKMCTGRHLRMAQWYWNKITNRKVAESILSANDSCIFREVCRNNDDAMFHWLLEINTGNDINIRANGDEPFRSACKNGNIQMAQTLIRRYEQYSDLFCNPNDRINIHAERDYAFRWACIGGHLHVAQWLVKLGESNISYGPINISCINTRALSAICNQKHNHIIQYLTELSYNPSYMSLQPLMLYGGIHV